MRYMLIWLLLIAPAAFAAPMWTTQQLEPNSSIQWGLGGYWPFDDGTANDSLGLHHLQDVHTENTTGIRGSARLFNAGQQDYLWYPDTDFFSWNLTADADKNYTWIMWVNMVDTTPTAAYSILAKDAVDREWVWVFEDTRAFIYHRDGSNSLRSQIDSPTIFNQGEGDWYQIAVRYTGLQTAASLDWYVNGSQVSTSDFDLGYGQAQNLNVNLLIGAANVTGSTTQYFDGIMDEIIFYTRALNDSEIAQLYGGGEPRSPLPSLNVTIFDEDLIGGFDYLRFLNFTGAATSVEVNDSRATVLLDGQTVNLTFSPINVNRTYVLNVTISDGVDTDMLEITYNITNQDIPEPQINATAGGNTTVNIDLSGIVFLGRQVLGLALIVCSVAAYEIMHIPFFGFASGILMMAWGSMYMTSSPDVFQQTFYIIVIIFGVAYIYRTAKKDFPEWGL